MSNSIAIFPIINSINGTINEMVNNLVVYEDLRYQFILTSANDFRERDIAKTIKCYLQTNLSVDQVTTYNSSGFQYSSNNTGDEHDRMKRIYNQYDDFINKAVMPIQSNLQDVANVTEDEQTKYSLLRQKHTLGELSNKYMEHDNSMKIIEILKYIM